MQQQFPVEREEKRQALLQAVDSVRDILAAGADEAEALRTLPQSSVNALRDSGLFRLKLAAELGGAEADPVTQIEAIEAVSYIDPSAGWTLFIGAGGLSLCAFYPDEAIQPHVSGWTCADYGRRNHARSGGPSRWRLPGHWPLVLGQWGSTRRVGQCPYTG